MVVIGCSGGAELLLPGDGQPAKIEVEEGNPQTGRVGEPLTDSLVFLVTDSRGRPVEEARIVFDLASSAPGMDVIPDTARTDANGRAGVRLVLGTTVGRQAGHARVVVPEGSDPPTVEFTANALPENANGIAAIAGDEQTAAAGSVLSKPLVVQVTDAFGNPVAGVPISWTAEGGGSVSEASNFTDDEGLASVLRTLGPTAGPQSTLASSSQQLVGSPVTFEHTATPGNASSLTLISGNNQTAQAGTRLPADLVVRLVDAAGNGIPNAAVTWVVSTGGGTVTPQNGTTDQAGYSSAQWTLGANPGANRLDAVVSEVGFVSFQANGVAGAPASLVVVTQPSSSARNGQPLARQPVVQVRDNLGNSVSTPGITITAQLSGGGGELLGTRQRVTDGSGRATFTDLAISAAEGQRILVFTASGYAGASSTPISVAAIGTNTTITSDSPDPSTAGQAVVVGFTVSAERVTPTGSVTVTDGVQSCTGTLTGGSGSCQLTLTTEGQRTLRATYGGVPGLNGSSATEQHRVDARSPASRSTTTMITSDSPDPSISGSTVTVEFRVTADGATPTGSVQVTVSGGTSTCTGSLSGGTGSCQLTLNTVGDRTLTATYSGAPGFNGSSDTESHAVSPSPPDNTPPDADFNWSCAGLTCSFTDASEDSDGTITSRRWTFGDGSFTEGNLTNVSHAYNSPGTYTVTLTVTDDDGASSVSDDQVATEELEIDTEPSDVAQVGQPFDRQPRIQITRAGEDRERGGVIITVTIASGGGSLGGTTSVPTDENGRAEFSNLSIDGATGPHTLRFSAEGFAPVTSSTIDVQEAPKAQSEVRITSHLPEPSGVSEPVRFEFTVDGNEQGSPTGTVNFTVEDGAAAPCSAAVEQGFCNLTFTVTGEWDVTATYNGDDRFQGDFDQVGHRVEESNQAPTAIIGSVTCTDLTCSFSDDSTDEDGSIVERSWDYGDQTPTDGLAFHTYAAAGQYAVTLTVKDNDQATDDTQQLVTVPFDGSGGGTSPVSVRRDRR